MKTYSNFLSEIIFGIGSFFSSLQKGPEANFEEERKKRLIFFILLILIFIVVPFSLQYIFQKNYARVLIPGLVAVGLICLAIDGKTPKVTGFRLILALFLIMLLVLHGVFLGAYTGLHSLSLYLFIFPPVVFFLAGTKIGLLWSVLLYGLALPFMAGAATIFDNQVYSHDYLLRFTAVYAVLCIIIFNFEALRQKSYQQWLWEKDQLQAEINRRKQTEQALQESQRYAEDLLNSTTDIAVLLDLGGKVLEMNRLGLEIYQALGFDNMIGRSFYDLFPSDRAERAKKRHASIIESKEPYRVEVDFGKLSYDTITTPILDQAGQTTKLAVFIKDISKEKQAEKSLRESEERYRTVLDSIEEGYFEVDLAGNFAFVNDGLAQNTGFSQEELIGKNNRDYMSPETARRIYGLFREIYETDKPIKKVSYEITRKDGSRAFHELSASLMTNRQGQPIGFRGIARDVTELKVAEEKRKNLEAQLIYAQKMESIGTLAGGIAHNFNNLLMGIQGNVSIALLDMNEEDRGYKNLINVEKLVHHGSKLTDQLLGYARGGKYEVKPLNLNHVIKETASTFGQTRKETIVHQDLATDLSGVKADQGQIEQSILNLFVNAVEAMPGGGEIFITTRNVTDEDMKGKPYTPKGKNYVLITIRDTGLGMDGETLQRIFEPFFTTKGLAKGKGLGLASVYGIIKAHDGYIDVESEKNQGTVFSLYLPATDLKVKESEQINNDDLETGVETILLVEDEEIIMETGAHMLERLGYSVIKAYSGSEALSIYLKDHQRIPLVILDIIMPGLGGEETFDRLKEINREVKVLLSSGYTIDDHAKKIMDKGCQAFIQKPFDINTLSRKVRQVLSAD